MSCTLVLSARPKGEESLSEFDSVKVIGWVLTLSLDTVGGYKKAPTSQKIPFFYSEHIGRFAASTTYYKRGLQNQVEIGKIYLQAEL